MVPRWRGREELGGHGKLRVYFDPDHRLVEQFATGGDDARVSVVVERRWHGGGQG